MQHNHKSHKRKWWIWGGLILALLVVIGIKVGLRTEPVNVPPGQHTAQNSNP